MIFNIINRSLVRISPDIVLKLNNVLEKAKTGPTYPETLQKLTVALREVGLMDDKQIIEVVSPHVIEYQPRWVEKLHIKKFYPRHIVKFKASKKFTPPLELWAKFTLRLDHLWISQDRKKWICLRLDQAFWKHALATINAPE